MTDKSDKHSGFLQRLLRDFWSVFSLPFRTVRFFFKKLIEIRPLDLALMAVFFVVLIVASLTLFLKATSQPGFCVTCHYMRPYFDSWKASSHRDVHCTKCHFPPGIKGTVEGKFTAISMLTNYFTGVYKKSKPWAEISDQSCLRSGCHETRLLEGKVKFKEEIVFDHTPHLQKDRRGKHLRCTSCHSQIVQGTHMTVTEETCFLCHFKDQPENSPMTSCTFCHKAPVAHDSVQVVFDHTDMIHRQVDCHLCHGTMVVGDGDVSKDRCSYCHAEAGKLEAYSQTTRIHEIHISENKVECNHCHNEILHQSIARSGNIEPDCQSCHAERHFEEYEMFTGQGATGVDPMPASMFHAGLGCQACHVSYPPDWKEHPENATRMAGPISCQPCHDEGYYNLYRQAEPVLKHRIDEARKRTQRIQTRFRTAQTDSVTSVCISNLDFLASSKPIHNLRYTESILNEINRSLDILIGQKPVSRALPDTTSERCIRCHYGQDEAVVMHGAREFSHRIHVHGSALGCATCHQEKPVHGKLNEGPFCMNCHQ
ncbi:NapC/NirT family cytochrome c, partial [bacterium]|nr:NapC/NirT family cytochrome c [bacterium]